MPISKQRLRALRRLRLKKFREQEQAFLIEGVRLCEEALRAEAALVRAFHTPEATRNRRIQLLLQELSRHDVPLELMENAAFSLLAETEAPQGIAALVRKKQLPAFDPAACRDPLILAIDGLADPGNLGTILRTAEWFGVRSILLSRATVELHNPKVVRSSMGSLFRLRVYEDHDLLQTAVAARATGWRLLSAEAAGGDPSFTLAAGGRDLLFIGSEAHGLVTPLQELIDRRITIPGGGAESLNAAIATAIVLYQLTTPHLQTGAHEP
ncbi:MAG TPA: RNA methyltransferase [bacterium]|nr:RNA methyltransferase [bacterium]HQG44635.1 RNA methyltransferase [bacterium]HQI49594.1 RNA methyltransferase [bacterium]HQJ63272.1 RNA methyltransferase [bacterium]